MSEKQLKPILTDRIAWLLIGLIGLVQLMLAISYVSNNWYADVFVSFAPYIMTFSFLAYILLLIFELKNYKNIWLNLALLIIFGLGIFNFQPVNKWLYADSNSQTIKSNKDSFRLASFNKLVVNRDIDTVRTAIKEYDIVAVSEIKKDDYSQISRDWKYTAISDCGCDPAYGVEIAVFSKYKIINTDTLPSQNGYGVALRASIELSKDNPFVLHAIHPQAPVSQEAFKNRNDMLLGAIAPRVLADKDRPAALVGDMNLSAYSKSYDEFSRKLNPFRNAGLGDGVWRTWCLGQLTVACAPIDHIFVSGKVITSRVRTVGVPGSDHMLITSDIVIK